MAYVLLVGSHFDELQKVAAELIRQTHRVERTTHIEEAINHVKTEAPDVLLVELKLDHAIGFDLLDALQESHPDNETKVVVIVENGPYDRPPTFDDDRIHAYVYRPGIHWQMLLSVEQFLLPHRTRNQAQRGE